MNMSQILIDAISQKDLKLTKDDYDSLRDLASYKHEDIGFSFFIRKDYIEAYVEDLTLDCEKFKEYRKKKEKHLIKVKEILNNMKTNILLIDNDSLISK